MTILINNFLAICCILFEIIKFVLIVGINLSKVVKFYYFFIAHFIEGPLMRRYKILEGRSSGYSFILFP